jgi:SAM-dependent methyltransferase
MAPFVTDWILRCRSCGFLRSTLRNRTGDPERAGAIDEQERVAALGALRRESFERILDVLERTAPGHGRLLDVGCAHGWFVSAALRRGWDASGIEPDSAVAAQLDPEAKGRVRVGWFPGDVAAQGSFAVLTFHDVFEHLDDANAALDGAVSALGKGGVLVLNLPWAGGILHRVALVLARAGSTAYLDRLWQRSFPSPHLSYFTPETLTALCAAHDLEELHRESLRSVRLRGLWSRLRYDRTRSTAASVVAGLGVVCLLPLLRVLPPDVGFQVFRRRLTSEG